MARSASTSSRNRFLLATALSVVGHGAVLLGAERLIRESAGPSVSPLLRVGLVAPRELPQQAPRESARTAQAPSAPGEEASAEETPRSEIPPSGGTGESATGAAVDAGGANTAARESVPESAAAESHPASGPDRQSTSGGLDPSGAASSAAIAADPPGAAAAGPESVDFETLAAGRILLLPDYPTMAKRGGIEGTVVIRLRVGADGSVLDAEALPPKAHRSLERAVLETVLESWSFPPPGREVVTIKEFAFELTSSRR